MSTRDLFIIRHAKSDWPQSVIRDFDRPLTNRGAKDAPLIARWLGDQNLTPDLLISSPAQRAKQTAEAIIGQLEIPQQKISFDKRLYLASTEILLNVMVELEQDLTTVMLIGHNPGLENLIIHLSHDPLPYTHDAKLLTTANVVQLRFKSSWKSICPKQGRLINFIRPKDLY